jgi:hypothetical protein
MAQGRVCCQESHQSSLLKPCWSQHQQACYQWQEPVHIEPDDLALQHMDLHNPFDSYSYPGGHSSRQRGIGSWDTDSRKMAKPKLQHFHDQRYVLSSLDYQRSTSGENILEHTVLGFEGRVIARMHYSHWNTLGLVDNQSYSHMDLGNIVATWKAQLLLCVVGSRMY